MFDGIPDWILKPALNIIKSSEYLSAQVNRMAINASASVGVSRPRPYSTKAAYTSWGSLTDKTWSGRHLGPDDDPRRLRNEERDRALSTVFVRPEGKMRVCPKSTLLFPSFAQYLTDGFIRTLDGKPAGQDMKTGAYPYDHLPDDERLAAERERLRRNSSTHNIDLCTLYGRNEKQTRALRLLSEKKGEKGRLRSQILSTGEYSEFIVKDGNIDPRYEVLDWPLGMENFFAKRKMPEAVAKNRMATLFAAGGDRVNSAPQTAMMNTLWLREHNRLAGEIERDNPWFDDDQVFSAARATVIVTFIRIVVEEYINHISPLDFDLRADPGACWHADWNRENWISAEFSLLYRWHPLIPDTIRWGKEEKPLVTTLLNNQLLIERGLRGALEDMSAQRTGEMGAFNTTAALQPVDAASIKQDRLNDLKPYWEYRRYLGMSVPKSFDEVSTRPEVVDWLSRHYKSVKEIDFYVGLFVEDRVKNSPQPPLILRMVALDAFTQALPNPLLSPHVFKEETFSSAGWDQVSAKPLQTMEALAKRNGLRGDGFIGMTREGWTPEA